MPRPARHGGSSKIDSFSTEIYDLSPNQLFMWSPISRTWNRLSDAPSQFPILKSPKIGDRDLIRINRMQRGPL
jgi:hypothetical protein